MLALETCLRLRICKLALEDKVSLCKVNLTNKLCSSVGQFWMLAYVDKFWDAFSRLSPMFGHGR